MAKKIKVLIDVFYYQAALSGIRTYINELGLGAQNSQTTEIDYRFSHDLNKWQQDHKFLNPKRRLFRWRFHLYYFLWKQLLLPIKILKDKPDIIICPDFVAPFWRLKTHKLCVIHDSLFWDYPKNYNALWRKYYVTLIKLGLSGNSTIITTSNHAKKKLEKLALGPKPIAVIFQSFLKSEKKDASILSRLDLKNTDYLLHVGSFDKRKDLISLVKAFKLLKDAVKNKDLKLVLAGQKMLNGNVKIISEIEAYILQYKLSNDILMPGYLTNEAIQSLYENAFLYVFPSVEEGFGIPILEAFAMRVPVVASDAGALREIGGGAVMHFKAGDFVALSQTIQKLLDSETERLLLIEKGNERLKAFSREKFIEDYERLILKISNN